MATEMRAGSAQRNPNVARKILVQAKALSAPLVGALSFGYRVKRGRTREHFENMEQLKKATAPFRKKEHLLEKAVELAKAGGRNSIALYYAKKLAKVRSERAFLSLTKAKEDSPSSFATMHDYYRMHQTEHDSHEKAAEAFGECAELLGRILKNRASKRGKAISWVHCLEIENFLQCKASFLYSAASACERRVSTLKRLPEGQERLDLVYYALKERAERLEERAKTLSQVAVLFNTNGHGHIVLEKEYEARKAFSFAAKACWETSECCCISARRQWNAAEAYVAERPELRHNSFHNMYASDVRNRVEAMLKAVEMHKLGTDSEKAEFVKRMVIEAQTTLCERLSTIGAHYDSERAYVRLIEIMKGFGLPTAGIEAQRAEQTILYRESLRSSPRA